MERPFRRNQVKLKDAELPLRVNKTPCLGVIRAAPPHDLLKDFQTFAKELEQEFASKLSQKCAGGTAGLQCGFAAKGYDKMEKGRGFIRESPSLVVTHCPSAWHRTSKSTCRGCGNLPWKPLVSLGRADCRGCPPHHAGTVVGLPVCMLTMMTVA